MKRVVAAMAAGALLGTSAGASCWRQEEASAAGVRELQSMLMVTALRCQASGHGMLADYNGFVSANRAAIGQVNDRLKAHFIHSHGPVAGQRAYDSFTTSMANGYGAGPSGAESCGTAASLAREAAMMTNSLEGLALLVEREGLVTRLPDGTCETPDQPLAGPIVVASVR
ncbi:hypothetical protein [uncultured Sphingomonas sp.]|uniref:hypothetical protein n=1 Tax=uncultured Sphingomonas sp. TaxID=158754 RepID=UPI0025CC7315|nr:hypothetical protein [uncultured Sphingomonas sp.]